jgi:hypothetical protein
MGMVPDRLNGFRSIFDIYLWNLTPIMSRASQTPNPIKVMRTMCKVSTEPVLAIEAIMERMIMPIISSITAATSMVVPARVLSLPISINIRTVIPMLVATSTAPMKSHAVEGPSG